MYHFVGLRVIRKSPTTQTKLRWPGSTMFRIIGFIICLSYLVSCRSQGASNKYKDAKHHPSEEMNKESKKADKKIRKKFLKTQKKNKKAIGKRGGLWSKKKKQYTN